MFLAAIEWTILNPMTPFLALIAAICGGYFPKLCKITDFLVADGKTKIFFIISLTLIFDKNNYSLTF